MIELEYMKVFLSPQVIAGLVVTALLILFRKDIRNLMARVAKIRFPGGSEVSTSQSERPPLGEKEDVKPNLEKIEQGVLLPATLNDEERKLVNDQLKAERAKAYLWEYRYLNYYLVYNTQRVLDWLCGLANRTSIDFYEATWLPQIANPGERHAIISALSQHYLIMVKDGLIEVTPKGREYQQWRGIIPSQAKS